MNNNAATSTTNYFMFSLRGNHTLISYFLDTNSYEQVYYIIDNETNERRKLVKIPDGKEIRTGDIAISRASYAYNVWCKIDNARSIMVAGRDSAFDFYRPVSSGENALLSID